MKKIFQYYFGKNARLPEIYEHPVRSAVLSIIIVAVIVIIIYAA
jgi:hypothetical protein